MSYLVSRAALILSSALLVAPAFAQDAPLLTVEVQDKSRSYDLSSLKALGEAEVETTTIWTEGVHRFTGVPLATLLADAGIGTGAGSEGAIAATAINDYSISIPLDEIQPEVPIVAYWMDGEEMSVRDKGPLWIVFPYDSAEQYRTEVIYSQSIWQLDRISVTETE
ncbi:molybdopterin-dependent oxidoreductase [Paracoccus sp. TK19116]|uniref:Molybdopterin-dependent oxidoreductase n=1 Tax=Paracoccus albicereus TaxID=2922394 RepID=A0ABT1MSJ4_9RHOB|nr:molybdopterin-dependent oxidoreductase [Paracoccus albicereus]MCQ0970506.1 molybdopterin-dependent oxidoreductase [Paracoccus albicereus]